MRIKENISKKSKVSVLIEANFLKKIINMGTLIMFNFMVLLELIK